MNSPQRFARSRIAAAFCSVATALLLALGAIPSAHAQKVFESAEAAMNAFGDAVATSNEDAMKGILGTDPRNLIPPVGAELRYRFLAAWHASHAIQPVDDKHANIAVGKDGWTLPIPLVKSAKGWQF